MIKTLVSCLLVVGTTSLAGVIAPAQAFTPLSLTKTFNNPTAEEYDNFGYSVSLSGTSALIGAYGDKTGASGAGSAYLFDTTTGTLKQTFNNPTAEDFDNFGYSVSLSGTTALIGAPYDSTGATGAGSAYLFDTTTGNLLKTFNNPTAEDFDYFGYSVSLSGTTALIGAYRDDTGATNAGSAYLFDTITGDLLKTFNNPTAEDFDYFGYSVSLSGTSALIGAPSDNTGATVAGSAYLFDTTTGNLLKTFNNPTAEEYDNFGYSVSLSGTSALIGAINDNTGATNAGSAYLFETTTGTLQQTFNNPTAEDYDYFGNSVSLSGTTALIGAYGDSTGATSAGSAYLYQETQTVQVPEPSLTILGTGVVLGVLPFLKKGKKDKEKDI
ncbi:PEP-CTERM sorting domain-containing protein [Microcystis sp.]|jgi:hypothetical protein|uniref:PEP-CTERM sorting domain-containing protein n=1 Tax=Microcystis sp. TaxID=1127 RepID=UPI003918EC45|nr:PEP-CTERM sorting domain-containing protein [Microcystis sp. M49637_WE12]